MYLYTYKSIRYLHPINGYHRLFQVVGLSRRLDKMKELADKLSDERGVLHPIECDLRNLEGTLEAFQRILEDFGPISILINNAAVLFPSNITGKIFTFGVKSFQIGNFQMEISKNFK